MRNSILILLIICFTWLSLIPAWFNESKYLDNIWNVSLFFIIATIAFGIPFCSNSLRREFSYMSISLGAWFFSKFLFEVINFNMPDAFFEQVSDNEVYAKYLTTFAIGLAFVIIREVWMKNKQES